MTRGADAPRLLGRLGTALGRPVQSLYLEHVHRHGPELRELVSGITGRIGATDQQWVDMGAHPDSPAGDLAYYDAFEAAFGLRLDA